MAGSWWGKPGLSLRGEPPRSNHGRSSHLHLLPRTSCCCPSTTTPPTNRCSPSVDDCSTDHVLWKPLLKAQSSVRGQGAGGGTKPQRCPHFLPPTGGSRARLGFPPSQPGGIPTSPPMGPHALRPAAGPSGLAPLRGFGGRRKISSGDSPPPKASRSRDRPAARGKRASPVCHATSSVASQGPTHFELWLLHDIIQERPSVSNQGVAGIRRDPSRERNPVHLLPGVSLKFILQKEGSRDHGWEAERGTPQGMEEATP